jgi:hypothetical protein
MPTRPIAWLVCGSESGVVRYCSPLLSVIVTQLVTHSACYGAATSLHRKLRRSRSSLAFRRGR